MAFQTTHRDRAAVRMWQLMLLAACVIVAIAVIKQANHVPVDGATVGDFQAALDQAARTHRPVVLVFTASWCPPCQKMHRDAWPDPRVQKILADSYRQIIIDVDKSDTQPIARRYNVQYIPTILIVDPAGTVLRSGSTMNADELLGFLSNPPKL